MSEKPAAPDADAIMALHDNRETRKLRAAVDQVVQERDAARDSLDRLHQTWAENKPAVAYKERAERAERDNAEALALLTEAQVMLHNTTWNFVPANCSPVSTPF